MKRTFQLIAYSLLLILIGILGGCGGSTTASTNTGSIKANLVWQEKASASKAVVQKASAPAGVVTVRVIVSATDITTPIQQDFSATANTGTVSNIPAGTGRTVMILGIDSTNTITHHVTVSNVSISAGQTNDLGTLIMSIVSNFWNTISTTGAPAARYSNSAVWTGSEMLVWGGNNGTALSDGGRYNPISNSWNNLATTNAPTARYVHSTVWTGTTMIVWGGFNGSTVLSDGASYNPVTDTWAPISNINAPTARAYHATVWTGSEMIVWGGFNGTTFLSDGAAYNPATDTWTPLPALNAPTSRGIMSAVWTDSEMIVWGGYDGMSEVNSGARYTPATNTWSALSATNAPAGRVLNSATWTGTEMIVWGGQTLNGSSYFNDGARYNPTTDTWITTNIVGAPSARSRHAAAWTGSKLILLNGATSTAAPLDGYTYDPTSDTWSPINMLFSPTYRYFDFGNSPALWTGSDLLVWGGVINGSTYYSTGGRYKP